MVYQEFDNAGHSRLIAAFQSTDVELGRPGRCHRPRRRAGHLADGAAGARFRRWPDRVRQAGRTHRRDATAERVATPRLFSHIGTSLYTSTQASLRASAPKAARAPAGLIGFGTTAAESPTARKVTHLVVIDPRAPGRRAWSWNGHVWVGPGGVQFTNVVVQVVPYKRLTPSKDPAVNSAIPIGQGVGVVVAGQTSVSVRWFRRSLLSVTNYLDSHAVPIPLLPGRSWIILAPSGSRATAS